MNPVFINYVLFINDEDVDAEALFRKCSSDAITVLESLDASSGPGVVIRKHAVGPEHPIPTEQALAYFGRGLSEEMVEALKGCRVAISLVGVGPFDPQHQLLGGMTIATGRMAKELNAFVHDPADSLTFSPPAFHGIRVEEIENGELTTAQFGVRAYRVEGGLRCVSMGMEKFGQSNVGIALFAEHHMGAIQLLMTLVMQHLIEADARLQPGTVQLDIAEIHNASVREDLQSTIGESGNGRATLELGILEPEGGDPEDLLGLVFKSAPGDALVAEQDELFSQMFGASGEVSEGVSLAQLQEGIEAARRRAVTILNDKDLWSAAGRQLRLAVEVPATREVVWVEVESWQEEQGGGVLLSVPHHTDGLKSGANYEFNADMIMDYTLADLKRVIEAGGIDEIIKSLQSAG